MQCQFCGADSPPDFTFCGDCGQQRSLGSPPHVAQGSPPSERDEGHSQAVVTPYGGRLRLANGEVVKKAVPVTSRRGPMGGGAAQLIITDARILFVAHTRNSLNRELRVQDIQLQDVNGVSLAVRSGLGVFGACFVLIFSLYALGALLISHSVPIFLLFAIATVIIAVIGSRRAGVFLLISARHAGSSPVVVGAPYDTSRGTIVELLKLWLTWPVKWIFPLLGVLDTTALLDSRPSPQAVALFQELGALILELQGKGVLSDAEWTPGSRALEL